MGWDSSNALRKRGVLGSALLSILSGHQRYAHINGLCGEGGNPALLGKRKVVSKDSVRRGFPKMDEDEGVAWLQRHLTRIYALSRIEVGRNN